MKTYIGFINENLSNVDIKTFPKDILNTLEAEYGHYFLYKFDWNTEQDNHPTDFNEWFKKQANDEFVKNLNKLIMLTGQDLTTIKRKEFADRKLKDFEDLIKDAVDKDLFKLTMKKYELDLIMWGYNYSPAELSSELKKVKDVFDEAGQLDYSKIEDINFDAGGIVLSKFESFVEKNPEFKGVFDTWKKLFDENMDMTLKELNAFRSSTTFKRIKELNEFLKNIRTKINIKNRPF